MTPEAISRAYNNRLRVPNFQDILALWDERSLKARRALDARGLGHWNLRYGPRPLNTLDLIQPAPSAREGRGLAGLGRVSGAGRSNRSSNGAPILFFIHGGYWRMLDKSAQTFIAPRLSQRGAMVVIPNYSLAPVVSLEDISLEIAQALAWVWAHAHRWGGDRERIVVAGHSAGGHLTGMALSCQAQLLGRAMGWRPTQTEGRRSGPSQQLHSEAQLPPSFSTRGVAISGLFDLAPLVHCEWLMPDIRLTPESIRRLSPARWAAPKGCRLVAVAGEDESDEFHRQNRLIQQAWGPRAVPVVEALAGRNHFDVLLDLEDDNSRLSQLVDEALGYRN